jgi:response regulator RpfG family c-di-GMP phosphodiesterase
MSDIIGYIRQSELFSGIGADALERAAPRFKEVRFKNEDILCREGDIGDRMFIITEGTVSVQKDMGWGERELQRLEVGEVVGEMSLIADEQRSATVQAVGATTCLELSSEVFQQLLNTEPHFAQQVAIILTKRLSGLGKSTSEEILNSYRALMFSLANLADSRDPETGAHLDRTRAYCALLADCAMGVPSFKDKIGAGFVEGVYQVSPLHDIGKVAIPDSILLKPARLNDAEYDAMKAHTIVGAESLKGVLEYSDQPIFHMAYNICLSHHERWDGTGYPHGLSGEDIPLEARIMAVADVYDALLSKRVYKDPMTFQATLGIIRSDAGTHFDPELAEILIDNVDLFQEVHKRFQAEQ